MAVNQPAQKRGRWDRPRDLRCPRPPRCGNRTRVDRYDKGGAGSRPDEGGAARRQPRDAACCETEAMNPEGRTPGRALVVGVTGISGGNLVRRLLTDGWEVAGLCRRPQDIDERITPLVADLEDGKAVAAAVRGTRPTHVFYATWSRRPTEAENCEVNGR